MEYQQPSFVRRVRIYQTTRGGSDSGRAGFSLIEITFALMLIALGLLSIFHLFPTGLRASYDAVADTRVAQFADEVLHVLRAQALVATNSPQAWVDSFAQVTVPHANPSEIKLRDINGKWSSLIEYPVGQEVPETLCYRPTINFDSSVATNATLASVKLEVAYTKVRRETNNQVRVGGIIRTFHTEVYNYGM